MILLGDFTIPIFMTSLYFLKIRNVYIYGYQKLYSDTSTKHRLLLSENHKTLILFDITSR